MTDGFTIEKEGASQPSCSRTEYKDTDEAARMPMILVT